MPELLIKPNEVHVWELNSIEFEDHQIEFFENLLSEDELDRAAKLRNKKDRVWFINARGNLRVLLGKYLNKKPRQVWIRYGKYGKPYLGEAANPANISFNLSHTRGTAVFAITKEREIGIDIEYIRPVLRAERILERFFSKDQRQLYSEASEEEKLKIFFKLWCGREACAKALGSGINLPGKNHDSSVARDQKSIKSLSVYEINIDPGFTASIAVSGTAPNISQRKIQSTE